jgi:hypothetical protein
LFNQPKAVEGVKVNFLRYNVGDEPCSLFLYFFGGGNPLGKLPFGTPENNCKMELTAWRGILLLQPMRAQPAKKFYKFYGTWYFFEHACVMSASSLQWSISEAI